MKSCCRCGKEKSKDKFPWKNKASGIKHKYCLECMKVASATHYANNKKKYIVKAKTHNQEYIARNKAYIVAYTNEHPCSCGESRFPCLEFHHLDAAQKDYCISTLYSSGWSLEKIIGELAKCVVLCANCHRIVHYDD